MEWGNKFAMDMGCAHGQTGGLPAVWPTLKECLQRDVTGVGERKNRGLHLSDSLWILEFI